MVAVVELISQYAWLLVVLTGAFLITLAIVLRARASASSATAQLLDELRALESAPLATRLAVNGRPAALGQLAVSVNRLLDRGPATAAQAEPLFEALVGLLPDLAIVHTDTILYTNRAAASLFGLEPTALLGKSITDLVRPAYRAMLRKRVSAMLGGHAESEAALEVQLITGDEHGIWAELYSRPIAYHGEPALLTVAKDITHRKSMEASLGRGKLQARITLESIGEGVITTDTAGNIDYMNEAAEELTGSSRSGGLGKRLTDLIALVDEVDRESLGDPVARCLSERKRVSLGRRALLTSKFGGRERSIDLTASPIRSPDGLVAGCVVIFHDVSELRGLARQMSYQASHDALTGLVNRAEFESRLEAALQGARIGDGAGHAVCYLDLDRFKMVNDTCGHLAGDNLLREIASLLRERVRDSDTVARLGGDEFGLLLIGCPLEKARQITDDISQAVADHRFVWRDQIFDIGVSIGVVEIGHDSGTAESVLGAADSACYVAKQQGRGRVHVYSARDEVVARQRGEIQWLQRLQRAIKEGGFELYVQPIVSVAGRVDSGPAVEVLLRMRDEAGAPISPAQFLQAAERYQLMGGIDRWVVQAALTSIASGSLRLPEGRCCSINLSGQTLGDETFLDFVVEELDRSGVEPAQVCFEVPESAVVGNLEHARRFINVLHGIGCHFALDDFGSGIGAFGNLKDLAIDYLKIDGAYIRNIAQDSVNHAMVAAMIKLARTLDFRIVAEEVEDRDSFETVRELGVDFVQGYIVERPHPMQALH
ncbi:MAG TPA: EAL domain-containing protein [Gammaproteobacteria bacterium]|nr:EAL domain-containing protein [Gammaproteobacteria bacterium]